MIEGADCGNRPATAANGVASGRKGKIMEKNKALGAAKKGNRTPRHKEHNQPGGPKNPFGNRPTKEELIAKLKEQAEKNKSE